MRDKNNTNIVIRDSAIDILKFLAVFLITWSHFDKPLGRFGTFATGGAFGDTLFFFMSGYTLLLSNRKVSFLNWYKRRINRIYPTVFSWALVTVVLYGANQNIVEIILHGGGYFVTCIMLYYLLFYPIKCYVPTNHWGVVMVIYFALQGGAFPLLDHSNTHQIYNWTWSAYFLAMLAGAIVGKQKKEGKQFVFIKGNKYILLGGLLFSIIAYYGLMYLERSVAPLAIFNIIPLLGFCYFLYGLCCGSFPQKVYEKKWCYWFIRFIGGLCLEVYLVQPSIISDKLNHLLPFNLIIIFTAIIMAAYILHSISEIWHQTFKDEDYNWKEVIKPF